MQLFSKKNQDSTSRQTTGKVKKEGLNPKQSLKRVVALAVRFQIGIIILAVLGLLGITALRMFSYSNPSADEARMEENRAKFKKITLNEKAIQRIKQLSDSQVTTGTDIPQNRTNPFAE